LKTTDFTKEKESSLLSKVRNRSERKKLLNFCANNYLGLSNHPEVMKASQEMIESHGYGMSSVRFICGTQDIHKQLEQKIADF
jgi:glycine C-acetyltransferase